MLYIDTHAHLGPWHEEIWTFTPEQFVALQQRAGISTTVVTSAAALAGELVYGNEWTFQQAERLDHLLVWLVLNPLREKDSFDLLERYKNHPKMVGVKIHPVMHRYPADIKATYRLFERVAPLNFPVLSHGENESYASPARMRRLAEAFPSLTLITAHFGAGAPGQTHEAIDAIQDCKTGNLYTDMGTGRAVRTGIIAQMVRAIGADRILFGTDSPLYEPMAFPTLLRAADISEAERALIAHQNAERLILSPRGLG
ncbi:MAG TPA: amidohydrolase family protein [Thermoflexales bacterium]|nr:amidohydrolase family protein [Thermoflexales bacterium]HQY25965.1 amidohydrolase family protein [Thermoflexales bacterium]HQZ52910.1 amidohydrolase family protein [Thermoflexales bacterium]HRA52894.1 amidohydrolase family protein [Thermoflexales bacterium]